MQKNLPVLTSDLKGGQLHESIRSREDLMSFRNRIALLLALSTLLLLVACGSNGNVNPTPPPSGSFSNADLSGTYVFSVNGIDSNGATYAIVGTFIANGKGGNNSITGGTIDINDAEFQFLTPTPVAPISILPSIPTATTASTSTAGDKPHSAPTHPSAISPSTSS